MDTPLQTIMNICFLLGGIAVMMFGMNVMGKSLEKVAGNNMKKMLGKMTTNRFAGVGVGTVVTAIINSSTATTVMIVGFVNIGLMNLMQATSVIMGANIGTTVMAQILSFSGGANAFNIAAVAALIAAVGVFLPLFVKKEKAKSIGSIMLGVGLIFIGLEFLGIYVDKLVYMDRANNVLYPFFENVFKGDQFPLLLILIGIVVTAFIHSSGAITGILIALGSAISFNNAVFIILGSNIGTCITSIVSSMGGNTNAKRAAVIHLLFNLFGCLLCIAPLWIWNKDIGDFMARISGSDMKRQIANFHTLFNLLTTGILLPLINPLCKLATLIVKEKHTEREEKHKLTYIDDLLLRTPPIAVGNIRNEIVKMSDVAKENINLAIAMLLDASVDNQERIKDNEDAINYLNKAIIAFMTKLTGYELSAEDRNKISSYYHVVSDIERVGDYAENVMEYANKLRREQLTFSAGAVEEIKGMVGTVNSLFDVSMKAFDERDISLLEQVAVLEEKTDNSNVELEAKHIERLKTGECSAQVGSCYLQTISNLERVADHITNVAFSIRKYLK